MTRKAEQLAAFTICTKNYLAYARALAESFLTYRPTAKFYVLFIDDYKGYIEPAKEKFVVIPLSAIKSIGNLKHFVFKYDVCGINTGVKPFFIDYLFENYPITKLFYFDTDILVFNKLESAIRVLDDNNIVLVPHILSPLPDDGKIASDQYILNAGCYNLGFIGLRKSEETAKFLKWWQAKTFNGAVSQVSAGLFRDQRPIDLVPSIFDKVVILKDVGYDVAYWNLHERREFTKIKEAYYVNGRPLVFYHYSGHVLANPEILSYHQNRHQFSNFGPVLRELFELYARKLKGFDYDRVIEWPYTYNTYNDGSKINDADREYFWGKQSTYKKSFDPFAKRQIIPKQKTFYWTIKAFPVLKFPLRILQLILGKQKYLKLSVVFMKKFFPAYLNLVPPKQLVKKTLQASNQFGITIFAKFSVDSGVTECAKSISSLIKKTGTPCSFVDIDKENSKTIFYPVNLFFLNADVIQDLLKNNIDQNIWLGKYNIGYFWWELETFPEKYLSAFNNLSEVWTGSDFCQKAIQKLSPVPVTKVPWRPEINNSSHTWVREDFGLSSDKFVFLYNYDSGHYPERKNPRTLVKSFIRANLPKDKAVLILKIMHFDPETSYNKGLMKEIKKLENIILITETYSRDKNIGLINACDCYISPHRSEGFGATMLEAMSLGKPVIATNYGGNTDFTTQNNSFLVDYQLSKLKTTIGPYDRGLVWAEPLVADLVLKMKYVYYHQEQAMEIGAQGKDFVTKNYDEETLSELVRRRLAFIKSKSW